MVGMPHLCLGTAQFGLDYGITNNKGEIGINEVKRILEGAYRGGIRMLDTTNSYGSAEAKIGKVISKHNEFRVTTKLKKQQQNSFDKTSEMNWNNELEEMTSRIGKSRIETLLVHNTEDLRKCGSKYLINWLKDIKVAQKVKRVGLSIYSAEDLNGIELDWIDVVQAPISLLDQRLLKNGTLKNLKRMGIAIHARSIYLQGLLLTPSNKWPSWMPIEVVKQQKRLERLAETKIVV